MIQGSVEDAALVGLVADGPPQFDLFLRRIGDIDSPELTPWNFDPVWRGHVVLAVITERRTARIAAARVGLGNGRSTPSATTPDDPRDALKRELERQREPSRSAIRSAIGDLTLNLGKATFHVTSAFAFRTTNAQLRSMRSGYSVYLEPEPGQREKSERHPGAVFKLSGERSGGARSVHRLVDEFGRWLEQRYYHDDWQPNDTSKAEMARFMSGAIVAFNAELSEPPVPDYSRVLPAPRSLAGFPAQQ